MNKTTCVSLSGYALLTAALAISIAPSVSAQCTVSSNPAYSTLTTADILDGVQGTDFVNPSTSSVDNASPGNRSFNTNGLSFHTIGNSNISHSNRCAWSRWYQTDGFIQGFRLFSGEFNRTGATNISARVEAFASPSGFVGAADDNKTYYWEGRYQIVEGQEACLFQLKQNSSLDWVMHLRMDKNKNVWMLIRQPLSSTSRSFSVTPTPTMINVGSNPFRFRVTYINGAWTATIYPSSGSSLTASGTSNWGLEPDAKNQFRWGTYNDGYVNGQFGNKGPSGNSRVLVAGARYGRF